MKIIIAGAGIGGMALAALLQQRQPDWQLELFERAPNFDHSGYNLGLYPVGSRIFHGLGLMEDFLQVSERMETYLIHNGQGELIHSYGLGEALGKFGYTGGLMRGDVIRLLRSRCEQVPLHFGVRVTGFEQRNDQVEVQTEDGKEHTCDLLVGADGIHSHVRRTLFGPQPDHETGWGCRVWMAPGTGRDPTAVAEYWGAGRLVGAYPVKGALGVIAAGPSEEVGPAAPGLDQSGAKLREAFSKLSPATDDLFAALPDDLESVFWWNLADFRCEKWVVDRVALLGDAACAFLPTAGVGASMALESAAVLADELSRTDTRFLPTALEHYEKRRKQRAEAFQQDSRNMARMMTIESAPLAWGRDQLMKFYTLEMLVKNIYRSLAEPI